MPALFARPHRVPAGGASVFSDRGTNRGRRPLPSRFEPAPGRRRIRARLVRRLIAATSHQPSSPTLRVRKHSSEISIARTSRRCRTLATLRPKSPHRQRCRVVRIMGVEIMVASGSVLVGVICGAMSYWMKLRSIPAPPLVPAPILPVGVQRRILRSIPNPAARPPHRYYRWPEKPARPAPISGLRPGARSLGWISHGRPPC